MFKNRSFIIILCAILFVVLLILMVCEMRNPEGGVALVESIKTFFGGSSGG